MLFFFHSSTDEKLAKLYPADPATEDCYVFQHNATPVTEEGASV